MLFRQLRAGNPAAITYLWDCFRPRLTALAEKTFAGRWQRMADAEDALQSAFISFWQRAERGDFGDEMTRDDLWNKIDDMSDDLMIARGLCLALRTFADGMHQDDEREALSAIAECAGDRMDALKEKWTAAHAAAGEVRHA